jgi:hypothetical protein
MQHFITQVYELPEGQDARRKFLDGVDALMKEHGVDLAGSSQFDEISYVDQLESEFAEATSEYAKEEFRTTFEREARHTEQQT